MNMSRGQCIKVDMCGVRCCCQHQSSLHQPTGVGQGLEKDSTHLTRPGYLRQLTAALSSFLLSCKCKKGCVRCCKCKKAALQCTALCVCEGDCGNAELVNMTLFMYMYLQYRYILSLRYHTIVECQYTPSLRH